MQAASFAVLRHTMASCDALQCLTKLLLKPVRSKRKTCCPPGKAFSGVIGRLLMGKRHPSAAYYVAYYASLFSIG